MPSTRQWYILGCKLCGNEIGWWGQEHDDKPSHACSANRHKPTPFGVVIATGDRHATSSRASNPRQTRRVIK